MPHEISYAAQSCEGYPKRKRSEHDIASATAIGGPATSHVDHQSGQGMASAG